MKIQTRQIRSVRLPPRFCTTLVEFCAIATRGTRFSASFVVNTQRIYIYIFIKKERQRSVSLW
jgi:hypothetical protein